LKDALMSLDLTAARQPDHPVDPQFPARWSPRSFSDAALTEGAMMTLLEAARWAPSASNHQPWRLVWARRGEAAFAAIHASLAPGNQVWAGNAAALIVVASKDTVTDRDGNETPNRTAGFDTGAAWMSLALQAQAMGFAAHAMGGFDKDKLGPALGLPAGHTLQCVVAVGEQGPAENLPENLRDREKPSLRKPLDEVAFHGRF
jgi:nitroreductase